ncbi:hypothetical protein [Planomicrobium sp. Y74]|uniref:hypothetical protein n=1 Tax=Planomicrobium sp. Y74 TaxID=2478977 RepID=UPI000EF55576|nr:hypothetical protein [Planomicrobium sp. Y74]RLQ84869.1 hypothetical protein D9754_16475 [Planomicrobium sp. Y74]
MISSLALLLTAYLVFRTKDYFYRSRYMIQRIRLKEEIARYRECLLVPPFLLYHYNFHLAYLYAPTPGHPVVKRFQRDLGFCLLKIISETAQHKPFVPESSTSPIDIFQPAILKELVVNLVLPITLLFAGQLLTGPAFFSLIALSVVLLVRSGTLLYHLFCLSPAWIDRKLASLPLVRFSSKSHLQKVYRYPKLKTKQDLRKVHRNRNQLT